ncbi:hypothetical protein IG197_12590 [Aminobacter sp. SR38]|jgi:hypothetical protein|uniref:hypothetical protein n=1 Tax=Aminobacter TaxID=31988 RepID=UPI0017833B7B|nr:hypothetical protein [Aminobacter sp. SR38]QOF73824.1 hypothetical protein IG197_12590 [Aminobacter sp. SR38]
MTRKVTLLGLSAIVAGCTTMSQGEYKTAQTALSGSPALKREIMANCIKRENARPAKDKADMATVFNINPSNYAQTFCKRMINGMASNRITYQDYRNLDSTTADNSRLIRVLQGR